MATDLPKNDLIAFSRMTLIVAMMLGAGLTACERTPPAASPVPQAMDWPQILAAARGQTVTMAMWQGDPAINAYMHDFVAPQLLKDDGITLRIVPGQGDTIVTELITEAEAARSVSAFDLVWINGETFYQLRQIHALYGPFTQLLPNAHYVDWGNPFIGEDFQQPLQGYECPWGNVQLVLITDRRRVPNLPTDPQSLAAWIHTHPGRFTIDMGFAGMSFLKSLMYAFASRPDDLNGPFDAAAYRRLRDAVFGWVDSVRPDLWHHGRNFPAGTAQLNELFANGELDFSLSFNDGEVDNRVASGLFPDTAYAFVLTTGTLQNSHYLGIVARSPHAGAAMVVANFLISPEAQLRKLDSVVWGDGTVLDLAKLPQVWRTQFTHAQLRAHAQPHSTIERYARREPSPQLMIELSRDFRQHVEHE
ncbi:MAG: ABC transporter substrate-binding protein [Pseudomonadota bacterium]|nr:ABC transporter substrate-binding protein [Pseudomonadota bacterium]